MINMFQCLVYTALKLLFVVGCVVWTQIIRMGMEQFEDKTTDIMYNL